MEIEFDPHPVILDQFAASDFVTVVFCFFKSHATKYCYRCPLKISNNSECIPRITLLDPKRIHHP